MFSQFENQLCQPHYAWNEGREMIIIVEAVEFISALDVGDATVL